MAFRRSTKIQKAYDKVRAAQKNLLSVIAAEFYVGRVIYYQEGYSENISSWVEYKVKEVYEGMNNVPMLNLLRLHDNYFIPVQVLEGRIKFKS